MAWKINKIKADLRSYPPYIIMGLPKIGKTTLYRDLVIHNYKDETKGLLISFGDEEGYLALDRLQVEKVKEWDMFEDKETGERGFIQIIDDLVLNKEAYGIEMVGFDTFDKMVELATQEVFKEHRRLKGVLPKSLNDALGGYGAGGRRVSELMQTQVSRLREVGYAVFILAHTKVKDKNDPLTGENYEQITNNLQSNFYNTFANIAQMIVNIVIERDIKDGKQVGERRMMHFRDNGIVDAGSRFKNLPDKLELSAENFMLAFETGVRSSTYDGTVTSDKELEQQKKEEKAQRDRTAKAMQEKEKTQKSAETELEQKKAIIEQIQAKGMTNLSDKQGAEIKEIVVKSKITKLTDPDNVSLADLQKIAKIMEL